MGRGDIPAFQTASYVSCPLSHTPPRDDVKCDSAGEYTHSSHKRRTNFAPPLAPRAQEGRSQQTGLRGTHTSQSEHFAGPSYVGGIAYIAAARKADRFDHRHSHSQIRSLPRSPLPCQHHLWSFSAESV